MPADSAAFPEIFPFFPESVFPKMTRMSWAGSRCGRSFRSVTVPTIQEAGEIKVKAIIGVALAALMFATLANAASSKLRVIESRHQLHPVISPSPPRVGDKSRRMCFTCRGYGRGLSGFGVVACSRGIAWIGARRRRRSHDIGQAASVAHALRWSLSADGVTERSRLDPVSDFGELDAVIRLLGEERPIEGTTHHCRGDRDACLRSSCCRGTIPARHRSNSGT